VIAVDTSALMAILLSEPKAMACVSVLEAEDELVISAGTVAEAMIVSRVRHVADEMNALISGLGFEVVPVTGERAERIARAYASWGRGAHPAGLNFGDCFAYELAKERNCPLLFVGADFSKTDLGSAL